MKEDAKRDLIPALIVFLVCLIGSGLHNWMTMVSLLPIICYALYFIGIIKPKEMYEPKPASSDSFWKSMYNYPHPIIMPRVLYALLGVVYLLIGFALFLIFPVNLYFWNWANISFKMASSSAVKIPVHPGREQPGRSGHLYGASETPVQDANFRPARPHPGPIPSFTSQKPPKPDLSGKKQASSASMSDPQAQREKMARMAEKQTIAQIEKNNDELIEIQKNTAHALDSMFGDSKITKAKFQTGFDSAVEMSQQNLDAAREYIKSGHNPEVLQKFLNRSQTINKKTGELLDALVTHQQNQMEDNLNDLTESLDELQESIKYYH